MPQLLTDMTSKVPTGRLGFAEIAIVTIIEEEFEALRETFELETNVPHTHYYVSQLTGSREYEHVLCKAPERGNHHAQQAVGELIEDFRPHFILLVGIAGGIEGRDGVALGDVIVANLIEYSESRKRVAGQDLERRIPIDPPSTHLRDTIVDPARRDGSWTELIRLAPPRGVEPKVVIGPIVAGEKIWGDLNNAEQVALLQRYDNAVAVDMESFGVGLAVHMARQYSDYNPQYLVFRGISDLVNAEANDKTRQLWKRYAASTAAAFSRAVGHRLLDMSKVVNVNWRQRFLKRIRSTIIKWWWGK